MPFNNPFASYLSPIIAHRGASILAPENTLAAFREASKIGAKWVEFDVMLDASSEIVVIHDETLDRTTNAKGNVADYNYSYLKTLDAGTWFDSKYHDEKIPTLKEVIELLYQLNLNANIEIKPSLGREEETVKIVLSIIDQHWRKEMQPPLISSFSEIVLGFLRQYSKKHFLGFLIGREWNPHWKAKSDEFNCVTVHMHYSLVNQTRVNLIKETNRLVLAYTVDDPNLAKHLFDLGVDAILVILRKV